MTTSNNQTCFMQTPTEPSPPLIQNGRIVIQAHHIGWAVTGFFTLVSSIVSFWLINKHLRWYTNKNEQRYIVRILFMVPIYSMVSFASYLFWNQSTPLLLVRDCYESTVLTSFFYLIMNYLSPNADEQRAIFHKEGLSKENDRRAMRKGEPIKKWMFPLSSVKSKPRDGLYFLQMMKWGILQYCVIRPVTTLVAVILDQVGLYCVDSWSPGWGHLYITVVVSISVSIAMYCLLQFYFPISKRLAKHKPLLKFFAIKAVVFLTFWQATFLSILSFFGVVKNTKYMTADDINIGIGAILETVEMTFFAFLHLKAFSYKPYRDPSSEHIGIDNDLVDGPERMTRLRALGHAFDFRETFRELWVGCVYMVRRWRGLETDTIARRLHVKEEVFGSRLNSDSRPGSKHRGEKATISSHLSTSIQAHRKQETPPLEIAIGVDEQVHINSERQWLGTGEDYVYGIMFSRRERSVGLADQIDEELSQRGIQSSILPQANDEHPRKDISSSEGRPEHKKQRSWWQNIYRRLSRTSQDDIWEKQALTTDFSPFEKAQDEEDMHWSPDSPAPRTVLPTLAERSESTVPVQWNEPTVVPSWTPMRDPVLTRLFNAPPVGKSNAPSEASGPSSQTHPTSHGHHVRLTAPAPAVPSEYWRASVRKPVVTYPTETGTEDTGVQTARAKRKRASTPPKKRRFDADAEPQGIEMMDDAQESFKSREGTSDVNRSHRRERAEHIGQPVHATPLSDGRNPQRSETYQRPGPGRRDITPQMPALLAARDFENEPRTSTSRISIGCPGLVQPSARANKGSSTQVAFVDPTGDFLPGVTDHGLRASTSRYDPSLPILGLNVQFPGVDGGQRKKERTS